MSVLRKTRVYVAGKMRGLPYFNFAAFDAARDRLSGLGFDVVSPADIDRHCGFDAMELPADTDWNVIPAGLNEEEIMVRDIDALDTCDAIYVLKSGVETSTGAQKEIAHAKRTGKFFLFDDMPDEALQVWDMTVDDAQTVGGVPPVGWTEEAIGDFGVAPVPEAVCDGRAHEVHVQEYAPAAVEIRVTDPTTGGQKGAKAERFDLLPVEPLTELARHYGLGAAKYDDHNYRKGYKWSLSFAACMRHLWAFWRGEDYDKETGSKHVIAAAFHCLALSEYMDTRRSHDDRYVRDSAGEKA